MVSFSCEACGDVLTKKKLDAHRNQCHGASFTCLDCMVHFQGNDYRSHTSCMTEAQKYEGSMYKDKGKKKKVTIQETPSQPRHAYVEDDDEGRGDSNALAIIDAPPEAPSPPPAAHHTPEVNVFDYLVTDATPESQRHIADTAHSNGHSQELQRYERPHDEEAYNEQGYGYGDGPLRPTMERYDSWVDLPQTASHSQYTTPMHRHDSDYDRNDKRRSGRSDTSDKKRKRNQLESLDTTRARQQQDVDMADAPTTLHSGLTGGLSRLLSRSEDLIMGDKGASPLLGMKRRKDNDKAERRDDKRVASTGTTADDRRGRNSLRETHHDDTYERRRKHRDQTTGEESRQHRRHRQQPRDSSSSDEHRRPSRKQVKAITYEPSREDSAHLDKQLIPAYKSAAELFMSFVTKGPDSERGMSVNKMLKRYHREREGRSDYLSINNEAAKGDKDLWKDLRVKRNDNGEVVLFIG